MMARLRVLTAVGFVSVRARVSYCPYNMRWVDLLQNSFQCVDLVILVSIRLLYGINRTHIGAASPEYQGTDAQRHERFHALETFQ